MKTRNISRRLQETFGDPIGSYAGESLVGVRDERSTCPGCGEESSKCQCSESGVCPSCGGMPVDGVCMCEGSMDEDVCAECGMMYVEGEGCGCTHLEEAKKKKGPSKKTAQKILRGTKTFKEKMKKVEKWADDPAAAAAWMAKKATGKWPSQE